jgi:hypothetical protein
LAAKPDDKLAPTKALLLGMAKEATELRQALGGSVTDSVAGWLATQYLAAAHQKLDTVDGAERWDVLRAFAQDWAMLRHGDHTAERLRIERERLKLAQRDTKKKWETKVDAGLNALAAQIKANPRAKALFKPLAELLRQEEAPRKEVEFREWIKRPEIRREIFPEVTRGLSPETLERIEKELRLL